MLLLAHIMMEQLINSGIISFRAASWSFINDQSKQRAHFPTGYSGIIQAQLFQQVELSDSYVTTCPVTSQYDMHSLNLLTSFCFNIEDHFVDSRKIQQGIYQKTEWTVLHVDARSNLSQRGSAAMAELKSRNERHKEGAELSFMYLFCRCVFSMIGQM